MAATLLLFLLQSLELMNFLQLLQLSIQKTMLDRGSKLRGIGVKTKDRSSILDETVILKFEHSINRLLFMYVNIQSIMHFNTCKVKNKLGLECCS